MPAAMLSGWTAGVSEFSWFSCMKSLGVSEVSDHAGLGRNSVTFTMLLSEYGERMHWSCPIPNIEFDPGDGNAIVLRINCLNSVDASTVLEIILLVPSGAQQRDDVRPS